MAGLPTGTVTLLFTDIEGSTPLVHRLGDGFGAVREQHRRLLRKAVADAGGHEVECRADEFFAVFQRAKDGAAAAVAAQRLLAGHAWPEGITLRVRMGLHTGEPGVEGGGYLGVDVHRAARICAAGHGGQILVSQTTRELVAGWVDVKDLGSYALAGLPAPERLFQLVAVGLRSEFPPLRAESGQHRRLAARLPRRRSRQPTFADTARQVRQRLPDVAAPLQRPLAELGAALFTADRAVTGADGFLARVDHERLTTRLAVQRQIGMYSRQARAEAERLQTRITCVEQLEERHHALASVAPQLPDKIDASAQNRRSPSSTNRSAPPPSSSTTPSTRPPRRSISELQTRPHPPPRRLPRRPPIHRPLQRRPRPRPPPRIRHPQRSPRLQNSPPTHRTSPTHRRPRAALPYERGLRLAR